MATYYYIGGATGSFITASDWSLTSGGSALTSSPGMKSGDIAVIDTDAEIESYQVSGIVISGTGSPIIGIGRGSITNVGTSTAPFELPACQVKFLCSNSGSKAAAVSYLKIVSEQTVFAQLVLGEHTGIQFTSETCTTVKIHGDLNAVQSNDHTLAFAGSITAFELCGSGTQYAQARNETSGKGFADTPILINKTEGQAHIVGFATSAANAAHDTVLVSGEAPFIRLGAYGSASSIAPIRLNGDLTCDELHFGAANRTTTPEVKIEIPVGKTLTSGATTWEYSPQQITGSLRRTASFDLAETDYTADNVYYNANSATGVTGVDNDWTLDVSTNRIGQTDSSCIYTIKDSGGNTVDTGTSNDYGGTSHVGNVYKIPVDAARTVELNFDTNKITVYSSAFTDTLYGTYCTGCTGGVQDDSLDTNYNVNAGITKTCLVSGPPQLAAPVVTTANITATGVSLLWTADENAQSYEYRQSTTAEGLESAPATAITLTDGASAITGLTTGTTYYWQVRSVGDGTNYSTSGWSTAVNATPALIPLTAPVLAVAQTSATSLTPSFESVENAASYTLERTTTVTDGVPDFTGATVTTSFVSGTAVTGLTSGTTYYFRLKSVGDGTNYSDSEYSNIAYATPTIDRANYPVVTITSDHPNRLTVSGTQDNTATSTKLQMTGVLTDGQPDWTSATERTITPGNVNEVFDGLTYSTTYYFRFKSFGNGTNYINSVWSDPMTGTTNPLIVLDAPEGLTATKCSATKINVAGSEVANASSYVLEVSTNSDFSTILNSYPQTGITKDVTGLTAETTYYFRVKAIGDGVTYTDSTYSSADDATTFPAGSIVVYNTNDSGLGSLRQAIADAVTGDVITFDATLSGGTIKILTPINGDKKITVDASSLTKIITVDGGNTFTDGVSNDDGCALISSSLTKGALITFNSLRLSNGYGGYGGIISGGTFTSCEISENTGGHYITSYGVFTNCEISGNFSDCPVNHGESCITFHGVFTNCEISGNTSTSPGWNGDTSSINCITRYGTFTNCKISGNIDNATSTIESIRIESRITAYGTFTNCEISGNTSICTADSSSGCVSCIIGGGTFTNCKISGNSNRSTNTRTCYCYILYGPSIYSVGTFTNCEISGNYSIGTSTDAGLHGYEYFAKNTVLASCTVAGNYGSYAEKITARNSIIAYNEISIGSSQFTGSNNITDNASPNLFVSPPVFSGSTLTNADTMDLHLTNSSAALGAGDNQYVTDETDLDGNTRIQGASVDAGCYEYQPIVHVSPPSPTAVALSSTSAKVTFAPVADADGYRIRYGTTQTLTGNGAEYHRGDVITGLTPNTVYYFQVQAYGDIPSFANSDWSAGTATLTLATPTDLTATATSNTAIRINFSNSALATGYKVRYGTSSTLTGDGTDITSGGSITGLTANTKYYIQVKAVCNSDIFDSDWTDAVQATTLKTVLAAPASITPTVVSDSEISIAFDSVTGATTYTLEYGTDSTFTGATSVSSFTSGSSLTGLTRNTPYYFRVMADENNDYRPSEWTSTSATTLKTEILDPTNLTATTQSDTEILIAFDSVENAATYTLEVAEESTFASPMTLTAFTSGNPVYMLDRNTTYYFRVKAIGQSGYYDSDYSGTASATTNRTTLTTPVLSAVHARAYEFDITFDDIANADGYTLEYWPTADSTDVTTATYTESGTKTVTGLSELTAYNYRLKATALSDADYTDSDWTDAQASFTTTQSGAPVITLTGGDITTGVSTETWTDPGYSALDDEDGAVAVTCTFTKDGETAAGVDLSTAGVYVITYSATDSYPKTTSATRNVTVLPLYVTPAAPTATVVSDSEISIAFEKSSNGDNGETYSLRYGTSATDADSTVIDNFTSGTAITGLSRNTTYYFAVKAHTTATNWESGWSSDATATTNKTTLTTPTVVLSNVNTASADISFESIANASSYTLEYSTDSDFASSETETVTSGDFITGLSEGTRYYFRLKAVGSGDYSDSAWSESVNATTKTTLDVPSNIVVISDSYSQLSVSFTGNTNASSFTLQYTTTDWDSPVEITNFTSGSAIIDLEPNRQYLIRVKAVGNNIDYVDSAFSDGTASATTQKIQLATPTLTATATGTDTIQVTFVPIANASSYTLEYSTIENFMASDTATVVSGDSINGLTECARYYLRLKAVGTGIYSDSEWSNVEDEITKTQLDTPVVSIATDANSATISGLNVTNASGYEYRKATTNTLESETPIPLTEMDGSGVVSGLNHSTVYYWQVRAVGTGLYTNSEWTESTAQATQLGTPVITSNATGMTTAHISGLNNAQAASWVYRIAETLEGLASATETAVTPDEGAFDITGLTASTAYYMQVQAVGDTTYESSEWSATVEFTTKLATPDISAQATSPTTATISGLTNELASGWEYKQSNSAQGLSNVTAKTASVSDNSLLITGLIPGQTYYWQVRALCSNSALNSDWSDVASATTPVKLTKPVITGQFIDGTSAKISGLTNANASYWNYKQSATAEGLASATTMTAAPVNGEVVFTGLTPGATYFWQVQAVGDGTHYLDSDWSSATQVTIPTQNDTPDPAVTANGLTSVMVSGLIASARYGYRYSTSETGFDSATTQTATATASGTFEINGLTQNTAHYFWFYKIGNGTTTLDSEWTTFETATTFRKLATPVITAVPGTGTNVDISGLTDVLATGWQYRYATSSAGLDAADIHDADPVDGSDTIEGLTGSTAYYIQARAVGTGSVVTSEWSTPASAATTNYDAPTGLTLTKTSGTELALSFNAVPRAYSYWIQYATDAEFTNPVSASVNHSGTTFAITGLTAGTTYYVRVRTNLFWNVGASAWSETASCSTKSKLPTPTSASVTPTAYTTVICWSSETFMSEYIVGGYVIEYSKNSNFASPQTITYQGIVWFGNREITRLDEATKYYYRIKSTVSSGDREHVDSDWLTGDFTTLADNVPVLTLNDYDGPEVLEVAESGVWADPGCTATDPEEGVLLNAGSPTFYATSFTRNGTACGSVDLTKTGTYVVTYSVSDSHGKTGTATRTIVIHDTTSPQVKLYGGRFIGVEQNGVYVEPGAIAFDNYDNPAIVQTPEIIKITGFNDDIALCTGTTAESISTSGPGVYRIKYVATDAAGNVSLPVYRIVFVKTPNAPDVELIDDPEIEIESFTGNWTDPGIVATEYDGDPITGEGFEPGAVFTFIRNRAGEYVESVDPTMGDVYVVSYFALDEEENATLVNRIVTITGTTLKLALNGWWEYGIVQGQAYNPPGVTASGATVGATIARDDGDLDVTAIGKYTETYTATDAKGNEAEPVERDIYVTSPDAPKIVIKGINPDYVSLNDTFTDPGAELVDKENNPLSGTVSTIIRNKKGETVTSIHPEKLADYFITYFAKVNSLDAIPVTRTVLTTGWGRPTLTMLGDAAVTIDSGKAYVDKGATAEDVKGEPVTVVTTVTNSAGQTVAGVTTEGADVFKLVYSARDSRGYAAESATRTVTVREWSSPKITLNGPRIVNIPVGGEYEELEAYAIDDYDGTIPFSQMSVVYKNAANQTLTQIPTNYAGTFKVIYSATNSKGKTTTATRTVAVYSVEPPENPDDPETQKPVLEIELVGSEYQVFEVGSGTYTEQSVNVYADGINVTALSTIEKVISFNGVTADSVTTNNVGEYYVSYQATYGDDVSQMVYRSINVIDTTPPTVVLNGKPIIYTLENNAYDDPKASATDNSGGRLTVITEGDTFIDWAVPGKYTRQYYAKDASGNESERVSRDIFVISSVESPITRLNGNPTALGEIGSEYIDAGVTVLDRAGNDITATSTIEVQYNDATGKTVNGVSTDDYGSYTLTYIVQDSRGLYAYPITRLVKVVDTTAPDVKLNGDKNVYLATGATYTDAGVAFSDNYTKTLPTLTTVIYAGSIAQANIVTTISTANPATYIIVYTVTDKSGNKTTLQRNVVIEDITAPVVTLNGDNPVTIEAGSTYTDAGATATDNVDGSPTLVQSGSVNPQVIGDYSITWTATDASGNSSSVTRSVCVRDSEAPSLSLNAPSELIKAERGSTFIDPGASAVDDFEGDVPVTFIIRDAGNNTVADFATMTATLGDYTIIYHASDSSGNEATSISRQVRVVADVTPPVITIDGDPEYIVWNMDGGTEFALPDATAYDAYEDRTWDITPDSTGINTAVVGEYEAVYIATDTSGNTETKRLPIYITSSIAPVIAITGDNPKRHIYSDTYVDPGATAADHSNNAVRVTTNGTVGSLPGEYRIKYTAVDGNNIPAVPVYRTVEAVTGITATAQTATTVLLTFSKAKSKRYASDYTYDEYILERSSDGVTWEEVTDYVSRETKYAAIANRIVTVTANTVFHYRAKRAGTSFYSEPIQTRTYAVTGLTATVIDKTTVRLAWDAMDEGTVFIISKKEENGSESLINTGTLTATTFDVAITPNILYTFCVKTSNSGLVKTSVQSGTTEITGLQVLYRSGYIKLWWNGVSNTTYEITRNGSTVYTSDTATWYNTKSSGENGPFEYNTDYTYSVKAIRNGLTAFPSEISTNAKIYAFDDFNGTDYYYIGGEFGSFQKREDWSLEMLGDPLDFPPKFGENYRFCIGTNATIDELPGASENVSEKGCINLKIFDDKTVEAVSSYDQVEILNCSIDGDLMVRLNVAEETWFDPVGVTQGVHLGLFDSSKRSIIRATGKFEITEGSILRCYGTDGKRVCLTDNLETITLKIDKTAKIYANVNREDKPFGCWMACFGWERTRGQLAANNESPLTITNDVYVGDLLIPVNPTITGNYRRFFIEGDIIPSPTSKFYWSASVISPAAAVTRTETTGTILPALTPSKQKVYEDVLADLAAPVFRAVMPFDTKTETTYIDAIEPLVEKFVVDYYVFAENNSLSWPSQSADYKTAFVNSILAEKTLSAITGIDSATNMTRFNKLADDIILGVGRCLLAIADAYSSTKTTMKEQTEICLIGNANQTVEFFRNVDFNFPVRLMKRRGRVTFKDFTGTVRGRCGFENCEPVPGSGITVDQYSKLSFFEDSYIADIILAGTIYIKEDIELRVAKSRRTGTSRIEGYSSNPNKTGGYLYVNDTPGGYVSPHMFFGTWTLPTHYYYCGGRTGSFTTASDWKDANGNVMETAPIRRNANVFHVEKPAALTGLSTSQIMNPADAGEPGKISLVLNGNVTIDSNIDYNYLDTVVINGGVSSLAKTSYIAFLEIYDGELTVPKGYARTMTFAFPSEQAGGYYLDAPEPVDYDITCSETGVKFSYSFLSGKIVAHDDGKIYSVGNDIYLMADSDCTTDGIANHLYVYGTGVTITGNHKYLGVYGSVTASGTIDEINVFNGGTLAFNGKTDSISVTGTATIQGYAKAILISGTGTVGACFESMTVEPGATATVNGNIGSCTVHDGSKIPHAKNELYVSGTATVSYPVRSITVNKTGTLALSATTTTLLNSGTVTTNGNLNVTSLENYGSIEIQSGYLRIISHAYRYAGSLVSGAGQYQLKWLYEEDESDGTITAFVQDYNIPNVTTAAHDFPHVWWKPVNGATQYAIKRIETEEGDGE